MLATFPNTNRKWLSYLTAHLFFEDVSDIAQALGMRFNLGRGRYFIRKAFCIATSRVPPSKTLNKFNVFLRKALVSGILRDRFEAYIAHMIFRLPCPDKVKPCTLWVWLPKPDLENNSSGENQWLAFSEPSVNELPSIVAGSIACILSKLSFDQIMLALNLVLNNKLVRILGTDRNEVFLCCEALRALVFPFKPVPREAHSTKYNTFIPYNNLGANETPLCSIFGFERSLVKPHGIKISRNCFLIDIDEAFIACASDITSDLSITSR